MERKSIVEEIKKVIGETTDIENAELLTEMENLITEKGINSIDAIGILVAIEDTFDIEIDDQDLSVELVKSIKNLADYVEKKI